MRKLFYRLAIASLLLILATPSLGQAGGWDKIKAFKARQILYVHNFIVLQTLYRFTNESSEAFRPSGEFGLQFYVPEDGSFVGLTFQGQNIPQLPAGQAKNYLSLPSGIPPGQSFMQLNIAFRKKGNETITIKDQAIYSVFAESNLYWEDKTLKVKSTGFKAADISEGMFMGKGGFQKVKVKYGQPGKIVQLTFSGGKSLSMEGANEPPPASRPRSGGQISITNKFWISSTTGAVAILIAIFLAAAMVYWNQNAKVKQVFAPTIRYYEKKRQKLLARPNLNDDEKKKLEILEAYIKHLRDQQS